MPGESTILRFLHRLKRHKLAEQILATVNELLAVQGLKLKAGTAVLLHTIRAVNAVAH